MDAALYFPFTGPKKESFLKTSLFLWDSVDFIVPFRDFRPYGLSDAARDAIELIGRNYVPTENDKRAAHDELTDICNKPIPDALNFDLQAPDEVYDFYPQKLLCETWDMLANSKLARVVGGAEEVHRASTGALFGYYMMSIVAVCCSRGRKRLVTDENDPYRALANILVDNPDSQGEDRTDWHGRLIALSFNGPNFADIPLTRLVNLRRQEDKLLQDLRRAFLAQVDQTAHDIAVNAENPNVVGDLITSFTNDMEKDLAELKRALGRSAASMLLSKEFGFSVLAATSTVALETISGSLLTMGGLTKGLLSYQDRRRAILREHPSSWLLAAAGPRMPIA